jgi:glycosyltransferase involved in cell wall biosynthesis
MSILFYDDSPVFGGHEVMSLLGIGAVLGTTDLPVRLMAASCNSKLLDAARELSAKHAHFTVEELPYHSSKLEAIRNRLIKARVRTLAGRFSLLSPELIVAIQGNIEHSSLALLAAAQCGIHCASYIPVPHGNEEMGAKFGSFRDLFSAYLFQKPDDFITITDEMARMLRARGALCSIHIVYNGIDTHRFKPTDQAECRKALGLPEDRVVLGMVGRVEFRQKQQHLAAEAIHASADLKSRCHLVFAGDGPDSDKLRSKLQSFGISHTMLPWSDPAKLYPALDALLLPSRYEGLPLVMLEALACGVPVFGSDRDGMKDFLPDHWLFDPKNGEGLAFVIQQWLASGTPKADPRLVARVRESMSLEAFSKSFAETVLKLARIKPERPIRKKMRH